MKNVIDFEKLENRRLNSDGSYTCACSACRVEGKDRTGNHLRVWPDGRFHCIIDDSKDHNKQILELVGTEGNGEIISAPPPPPKIEIPKEWDLSILKGLIKKYDAFLERGITTEVCDKYQIGVAIKGAMANRIVVPILNEQKTKIVAFTGRKLEKESDRAKWKHLGSVGSCVWPLNFDDIRKVNTVILVESPGDALYLESMGIKNIICLFGVNISGKVIGKIIQLNPGRILISTNNDKNKVGNNAALKIREKLTQFFSAEKLEIALPTYNDFGDFAKYPEKDLQEWCEKFAVKRT